MFKLFAGSCAITIILSACANIDSINRTTYLEDKQAKAIHLDAKQRLLIVNNIGRYCAEPAPDALSAFAASVGLGASAPGTGAASLSGANKSDVASIGLRTQSITLMRDALYRMCEAYGNRAIGEAQVVTLLNRSQDLTAVILAVEQLTGAVAASQVALTGSAGSSANAIALNSSKLLGEASKNEERALERLSAAKTAQGEAEQARAAAEQASANAKTTRDEARTNLGVAKAELDALTDVPLPEEAAARTAASNKIVDAKTKLAGAQAKLDGAEREVQRRETTRVRAAALVETKAEQVAIHQKDYDEAQKVTAEIAKTPNTASSATTATTGGSSRFGAVQRSKELSPAATQAVADAVKTMVTAVLEKDYVLDSCMSVITSNRLSESEIIAKQQIATKVYCEKLVEELVLKKAAEAEEKAQAAQTRKAIAVAAEAEAELRRAEAVNRYVELTKSQIATVELCVAPSGAYDRKRLLDLFDLANKEAGGVYIGKRRALEKAPTLETALTEIILSDGLRPLMNQAAKTASFCKG